MASEQPGTSRLGAGQLWLRATLLALAWIALGQVSARFVFPPWMSSAIWLPSGLALAVLVRAERRHWPAYGFAIFLAQSLPGSFSGTPAVVDMFWGVGNSLAALGGAWLLRAWPGLPLRFFRVRDVAGLLAALLLGSLLTATLGVGALALWSNVPAGGNAWLRWYVGDVLGGMLSASLVLAWVPHRGRPRLPSKPVELALTLGLLLLLAHLLFSRESPRGILLSLPYASFPAVLWVALRHGPKGATLGSVVLGAIAAWHTAAGHGPFGELPTASSRMDEFLSLEAFVAILDLSALTLAALVSERRRAEHIQRRLARASAVLAESMDDRVTMPRIARLVVPELATGFAAWRVVPEGGMRPVVRSGLSTAWQERLQKQLSQLTEPRSTWVDAREGASVVVRLRRHGRELGAIALVKAGPEERLDAREVMLAEDLAHRCALALENARLFEESQQDIHLRDEFITLAAHELKTPLTSLKQSLQGLASGVSELPHPERPLSHIHRKARQVSRLSLLVDNLLAVGHLNTGQLRLERERVELDELVRELVERLTEDFKKARCTPLLRLQAHTTGWWDRARLEQALLNLLGNAMKFGAGHPISIEVSQRDGLAHLVVEDHGIGVAPEALERIFDRFERAVSSTEYGGLGLGLFLTRGVVEAHGGSIHVTSRPGEGTTFTLELPAHPVPEHAGESAPPA
jgi:signal transduction histidine kinase